MCHRTTGDFEVFDSLGSNERYIQQILKHVKGTCEYNETAVQSKESKSCGQFCLYFVIQRYFNEDLDLEELLEDSFGTDCAKNEEVVLTFLKQI